jgi:acyl-CoA thioester hydrolase
VPRIRWHGNGHCFPIRVRWSDLDSYGHANNVKYYDYIQEARIAFMVASVRWPSEHNAGDVWMVVRQDVEYRRSMDFRTEPYEVGTVVARLGNRSITLAAEIRDPITQAVYASARTIMVGQAPLTDEQRAALGPWLR